MSVVAEYRPRIAPLEPPFDSAIKTSLEKMMGARADLPPLALFRTFLRHPDLGDRIRPLGSGILQHGLLPVRERELVIHRTCARLGCEYEWGVHASVFAPAFAATRGWLAATVTGDSTDPSLRGREPLIVRAVDELTESSGVSDALWVELQAEFSDEEILELLMICGWYHLIAFVANGARVPFEPWALRFVDVTGEA